MLAKPPNFRAIPFVFMMRAFIALIIPETSSKSNQLLWIYNLNPYHLDLCNLNQYYVTVWYGEEVYTCRSCYIMIIWRTCYVVIWRSCYDLKELLWYEGVIMLGWYEGVGMTWRSYYVMIIWRSCHIVMWGCCYIMKELLYYDNMQELLCCYIKELLWYEGVIILW